MVVGSGPGHTFWGTLTTPLPPALSSPSKSPVPFHSHGRRFVAQAPEPGERPASPLQSAPGRGAGPRQGSCVGPGVGGPCGPAGPEGRRHLLPRGNRRLPLAAPPRPEGQLLVTTPVCKPGGAWVSEWGLHHDRHRAAARAGSRRARGLAHPAPHASPVWQHCRTLVRRRGSEAGHVVTARATRPHSRHRTREPRPSGHSQPQNQQPAAPLRPQRPGVFVALPGPGRLQDQGDSPL